MIALRLPQRGANGGEAVSRERTRLITQSRRLPKDAARRDTKY